ncbi:MAG: hypothetical protein WCJ24_03260 [Candidatus Saccharibacteria bacterium]
MNEGSPTGEMPTFIQPPLEAETSPEVLLGPPSLMQYGLESIKDEKIVAHGQTFTVEQAFNLCDPFAQVIKTLSQELEAVPDRENIIMKVAMASAISTIELNLPATAKKKLN